MNQKAEQAIKDFLTAMGIDLAAQNMEKTPARVVEMYEYLLSGRPQDTAALWGEQFPTGSRGLATAGLLGAPGSAAALPNRLAATPAGGRR